jgi:hypothetical protein
MFKWVRLMSKDGKRFECKIVDTLDEAYPGFSTTPGEKVIVLLYVSFFESTILPHFELDSPGFRITYVDDRVFPRQVGIIVIRGTPPEGLKEGDRIPCKLTYQIRLVGRDLDDRL